MAELQKTIVNKLRHAGERITPLRIVLLDTLAAANTPKTVPEILEELGKRGYRVNKTTIYRQLTALVGYRIVSSVNFGDLAQRYELADEHGHHHHAICLGCGQIEDVDFPTKISAEEKKIQKEIGFKVVEHSLEFFGFCKRCQATAAQKSIGSKISTAASKRLAR